MHVRYFEKQKLATNIIKVFLLVVILLVVTYFNRPIRRFISTPKQLVEGAKDGNFQDLSKENFTKALAEDTKSEIDTVKEHILDTTIRDIMTFIGKKDKITEDINKIQKQTGEIVNKYDPFKK